MISFGTIIMSFFSGHSYMLLFYSMFETLYQVKNLKSVNQLLTFLLLLIVQGIWINLLIFYLKPHQTIILLNFCLKNSLIISKMIICTMTKVLLFCSFRWVLTFSILKSFPQWSVRSLWFCWIYLETWTAKFWYLGFCAYWTSQLQGDSYTRQFLKLQTTWEFIVLA